jgi:hypothetical protein
VSELLLSSSHAECNEQFQLPDGGMVGTGCILPLAEDRLKADSEFRVFGESLWLDESDIPKLVTPTSYKEKRDRFRKWLRNQSNLGKCNASATTAAFEQRRDMDGLPHVALSDNHLYMNINGGNDGGSLLIDGLKYLQAKGQSPRRIVHDGKEYLFPETAFNRRQIPEAWLQVADAEAMHYRSWEPMIVPRDYPSFRIAIASAVARDYPIIIAWHVSNASMRLNNGYIVQGRGPGNHATFIHSGKFVGGKDLIHPDNQNSWGPTQDAMYGPRGTGWGDGGYGLFTMESLFQCRQYHEFWVMVSSKFDARFDPSKG